MTGMRPEQLATEYFYARYLEPLNFLPVQQAQFQQFTDEKFIALHFLYTSYFKKNILWQYELAWVVCVQSTTKIKQIYVEIKQSRRNRRQVLTKFSL